MYAVISLRQRMDGGVMYTGAMKEKNHSIQNRGWASKIVASVEQNSTQIVN